jgi:excisionase family DNA binding protein
METLLTVKELAEYFSVSEAVVRKWEKDKTIPGIHCGPRMLRFRLADVIAAFEDVKKEPDQPGKET